MPIQDQERAAPAHESSATEAPVRPSASSTRATGAAADRVAQRILAEPAQPEAAGILYVGMNKDAKLEATALQRGSPKEALTDIHTSVQNGVITGANGQKEDLTHDDGVQVFLATVDCSPADREELQRLMTKVIDCDSVLDEARQVILAYARANKTGTGMRRVVLSGHSDADDLGGDNGDIPFQFFMGLAKVFPRAAAQVEDLMLSTCYSGGQVVMEPPKPGGTAEVNYHLMFPNVKTIQGYAGSSPSIATGSPTHIARWEKATQGHPRTLDPHIEAGLHKGENVATWSIDGGYQSQGAGVDEAASEYMERIKDPNEVGLFQAYFKGEKDAPDPNEGDLKLYYDTLQLAAGNPDVSSDDLAYVRAQIDVTVRLRYWKDVAQKFQSAYATTLQPAYRLLGRSMPDFGKLSRKEALVAIAEFDEAAATNGQTRDAQKLLDGLRDLSKSVIPFNWV
jgi:hypothetical protein